MFRVSGSKDRRELIATGRDGEAATCEDFVKAMEEGGGIDLGQFRLWYSQAGTPRVAAVLSHDAQSQSATLTLSQSTPDTPWRPTTCRRRRMTQRMR